MTIRSTWEPPRAPIVDPKTGLLTKAMRDWCILIYEKLGKASPDAPIRAANIYELLNVDSQVTGELKTENAVINLVKNVTNNGNCDSIDAGASATVRVYGPGGAGTAWDQFRNGVPIRTVGAVSFTGKAYGTRYYLSYDVLNRVWAIATEFTNVTGDQMVIFSTRTVDAGGANGVPGGGASGVGGFGGVDSSGRAGYGMVL